MPKVDTKTFTKLFGQYAYNASKKTGLPALLIISQAMLESGRNTTPKGNNFFGIKADASWSGPTITFMTHETINGQSILMPQKFRQYANAEESFVDWGNFLKKNPRYANVFKAKTAKAAAVELQKAKYATATNYADVLGSMIDSASSTWSTMNFIEQGGVVSALLLGLGFGLFMFVTRLRTYLT